MYEVHGWAALRYHTHDTDQVLRDEAFSRFVKYMEGIVIDEDCYMISRKNGLDSFSVTRLHNHKYNVYVDIFKWIAENLPGSYGLLYIWDDVDVHEEHDNSNKFVVWKLSRGKLEFEEDPFLSPCIPTIEDDYDPTRDD
ncbi:MAG TPA: Imm7 family immunity protein [Clostridia bacterium]|nr:Imm7 family immunity protein [Clostridia bacterium]